MVGDVWAVGPAYEAYVGRWSRRVSVAFVHWLGAPAGLRWLDIGCGTGALTSALLPRAVPQHVMGMDLSAPFVTYARAQITDPRATFNAADARSLPLRDRCCDVVVSGLALNFVPDAARAAAEFARVTRPGGMVAAFVWDYAEGMQMMRTFWDAAIALDPEALELDEGKRFPLCHPDSLRRTWADAGLEDVTVDAIDMPTTFADFDDYWTPFLGGQGPAPGYVASLLPERRDLLRDTLRDRLPIGSDGSIALIARVWAVKGTAPGRPLGAA